MDARRLGRMRPGAFLYNVSRGAVIDQAALVEALRAGKLAGAGLDVFEEEPLPAGSPCKDLENVILTPHVAGVTGGVNVGFPLTRSSLICSSSFLTQGAHP
jgi:(S)-sulfolactate dehydrogenase